ncbi:hypothetical protein [Crossiella sp. NPDC003009]
MDVEVDLYSGRPNPRFRLDPATGTELLRRLAGLDPAPAPDTRPDPLGYRGLRVEPGSAGAPIAEVVIAGGAVLVRERGGRELWLVDRGRELERWLAGQAGSGLDAGVLDVLREELS